MKKLILTAMLFGGLFTACQKETEKPPVKEEISRSWKIYEYTLDTVTIPKEDLVGATQTFQKDGIYSLSIPRKHVKDWRGTWELNSDNTKFYTNKGTDSAMVYRVVQLNTFMFKIKSADPDKPAEITYIPNEEVE